MKTIPKIALAALLILSPSLLEASPYGRGHHDGRDHYDRGGPTSYRPDVRGPSRHHSPPHRGHNRYRTEREAQLRLRQLGYYRGPIDGIIGRGTQYSIIRFQRDYRLPRTGWLDHRTLRALRVSR